MSALESQSRHEEQTHHQRLPWLLRSSLNKEQKDSTKKGKQHQQKPEKHKPYQRSSRPPRPSPSDVRPNVTRTEPSDERKAQTTKTGQAKTVHSPDETRPVNREGIPDSECIIDSRGRSLEPGDAVRFVRDGRTRWGIYVGGQEVVWSEETDRLFVHKGQLQLTDPFGKLKVHKWRGFRVLPPEERVCIAKSRVGTPFTEGDVRDGRDFPHWVYTGLDWSQAWDRGFSLDYWDF